ncbi:MAG: Cell division protein ftsA [Candidatus Daviesbacteria bacterium GW2011_GWB1_39_5]|uniref:Cell division protein FtsA n=1 Tax=Candidatus Daviesbacteria bacterium GW2011_GWC2_40_12 TaxID=1618431 RepID=A0A0G0QRH5_9BACT|nr:MAG: Cell division protein ftsA [Candidatus Daviesbacteria bacterium GW2011_GWA2_39_33]KKR24321.1 MAG: Cell division protein ftsA [Candidatus Daviesbacteria bacterium GW2011_GWB1_39_5]KKR42738.1 MAG: Cell division protein ftsA [Candidatus Daviesbacteria bacterium GW2011_GWC2_40_12]OGE21409.1 MAG: cell division protein FtsA [Candidatus Daviesbacteria bacterium RIFCSPHIGHO2_01_FULL_40_24]OGE30074.1 MAG: cell division protein FtsA [Candidatus Daviesbacteria bacterium RIFCSPHIGHO2_02_FULL_40_16]
MAKDRIVCGIDVGSSKIATLIASVDESPSGGGKINLIGVSSTPSKGVKKTQVVDIEEAIGAITESVEAAERMAGYSISQAFISLGGPQVESVNQHAVVAVSEPDEEIKESDVKRVNDAARAIPLPSSREILHVIPRNFTVDGQEGIKDPIGMTGVRLETQTHIITGSSTSMRNLVKCVSEVGIDVSELVFSGIGSSVAVLSDTEKELGVVLVDVGGETTDVVVFIDGSVAYSSVIPIGARHITSDMAVGLRVSLESAEKIKLSLGRLQKTPVMPADDTGKTVRKKEEESIDIKALGITEDVQKISRKAVVDGIIRPRLQEIFKFVGKELKKSGFATQVPSGLVICGGGALTVGVLEQAKYVLGFPARLGQIEGLGGLVEEIDSPAFAAAAGLILYGATQSTGSQMHIPVLSGNLPIKGMIQKGIDLVKSFLP